MIELNWGMYRSSSGKEGEQPRSVCMLVEQVGVKIADSDRHNAFHKVSPSLY